MNLTTRYMTRNDCYKAGRYIIPQGIMVHSTAAPGVMAAAWFDRWNKSYSAGEISIQACVTAFVDDSSIFQYLPWNMRGWHAGGSANNTHIGFEICEPAGFRYGSGDTMIGYDVAKNEAYFRAAWANAVALCVFLCQMYGLTAGDIICHSEGSKLGIASNHGDVMHWFPKHGEDMDTFRAAVKAALELKMDDKEANDMVRYARLGDIPNHWDKDGNPRTTIQKLMDAHIIQGDGSDPHGHNDVIDLSYDMVRTIIIEYRGGAFDRALIAAGLDPAVRE